MTKSAKGHFSSCLQKILLRLLSCISDVRSLIVCRSRYGLDNNKHRGESLVWKEGKIILVCLFSVSIMLSVFLVEKVLIEE